MTCVKRIPFFDRHAHTGRIYKTNYQNNTTNPNVFSSEKLLFATIFRYYQCIPVRTYIFFYMSQRKNFLAARRGFIQALTSLRMTVELTRSTPAIISRGAKINYLMAHKEFN